MKITRKQALQTIGFGFGLTPIINSNTFQKTNFKEEFKIAWKSSENYTFELFEQMPEKLLDWKYTPESFSWRMQFVHCIIYNSAQFATRLDIKDPFDERTMKGGYWKNRSKKQLAKDLKEFYDWVLEILDQTSESKLQEMTSFGTDDIPIWRLFYALENHIIHHRGQAVCYLRLNGITPVGYVGW